MQSEKDRLIGNEKGQRPKPSSTRFLSSLSSTDSPPLKLAGYGLHGDAGPADRHKAPMSSPSFRPISSFDTDVDTAMRRPSSPLADEEHARYGSFESYQGMEPTDGTEGSGYNCIDFDRWEADEARKRSGHDVQDDGRWEFGQWVLLAIVGIGIGLTCFLINFCCAGLYAIKAPSSFQPWRRPPERRTRPCTLTKRLHWRRTLRWTACCNKASYWGPRPATTG